MFVEAGHALLRAGGQLGMIAPSGLYTDKGSAELRRLLLGRCRWRWLYGFENRNKVFDIDSRFKFCVTIAEKGGETEAIQAAFMRHDLEDWAEAKGTLAYPAERVTTFSPKSLSVLEIRSERDLAVLTKIYTNSVLVGSDRPDGWGIRYATEFHMTNDSKLFIPRDKAEAAAYEPDEYGSWIGPEGDVLLPLYEGRMIGQFDFSEKGWVSGKGRSAVWRELPWDDKRIQPQFLMRDEDFRESGFAKDGFGRAAFMDVSSSTNRRTMVSALIPAYPAGNKTPILLTSRRPSSLVAALNSLVFDWQLRQRLGGVTVNYFIVEETALPQADTTDQMIYKMATRLSAIGAPHAVEYSHWTERTIPWKRLWAITPHERLRLRCMLDAIMATQYGLNGADFRWILKDCDYPTTHLNDRAFCGRLDPKGFWRIDRCSDPELRQTVLSVVAFDDLQTCISLAEGDHESGIRSFLDQNGGEGWFLPETVCVRDLGLTRTVNGGSAGSLTRAHQPVRSRMGGRYLAWQDGMNVEESWAEWRHHLQDIRREAPISERLANKRSDEKTNLAQLRLFTD